MSRDNPEDMKGVIAKGSAITGAVTVLMRIVNFVGALYLLRILEPTDFGVVALAMLLVGALSLFADLGMGPALIYSSHNRNTVAFQAFVMSTVFSATLSLLIYINADYFAGLLGAPEISPVLAYMAFYLFIATASTIPFCSLRKDLRFKQIGFITFFSAITVTLVQLCFAFFGFGLWSLVFGAIAGVTVKAALAWWFCSERYWLKPARWDWQVHRDLLRFGLQTTGTGIISYAYSNFDDWLIGRVLGTTALGYYTKAYDLTHKTTNQISRNIIGVVFFPAYARLRNDLERLTRAYLKSLGFVLIVMTPLGLGMLILAPDLVRILFGEKWLPMVPVMQIYAVVILTRPISENSAPLFQSLGKPGFNFRAGLLVLVILVPLSLLFVADGITGVALAVAIAHFSGMCFNVYQANSLLTGTAIQSIRLMISIFACGLLMAVVLIMLKAQLTNSGASIVELHDLLILIAVGALSYGLSVFFTQRAFLLEVIGLAVSVLKKGRKSKTKL